MKELLYCDITIECETERYSEKTTGFINEYHFGFINVSHSCQVSMQETFLSPTMILKISGFSIS